MAYFAKPRNNNSQAVRVILSQLYLVWASEQDGAQAIKEAIADALARLDSPAPAAGAATLQGDKPGVASLAWTSSTSGSSSNASSGVDRKRGAAYGGTTPAWHADPTADLAAPTSVSSANHRSASPPPTSPSAARLAKSRLGGDDRTPSPVQPTLSAAAMRDAAATRFLGVDEVDIANHRLGSPGGGAGGAAGGAMPTSPHVKPVVDPQAPLPHTALSVAAAAASGIGEGFANAIMPAVVADLTSSTAMADTMASTQRDAHSGRGVLHMSAGRGHDALLSSAVVKPASVHDIPRFYTAALSRGVQEEPNEAELASLKELLAPSSATSSSSTPAAAAAAASSSVTKANFGDLSLTVFKVPTWLKDLLFETIATYSGLATTPESLTAQQISDFYNRAYGKLTPTRRLFELIRGAASKEEYLTLEQLKHMTQYLVACHPGLEFLKQPEFQEYYCRTVAIRIMYALERQQCGKVTWRDFDRSNLPDKMMVLDTMDVNLVLEYFSYEHFYVLYCKFWELDTDRDLLVDYDDMCNYGQGCIVPSVIKRVVEGCGRALSSNKPGHLDFEDFVYFCLSEEDKNTDPAVLYWFKVLDTDRDGVLSGYELYQFYRENYQRFSEYSETGEVEVNYEDAMCQMLDMLGFDKVKAARGGVTLADLRMCATPSHFFNMIFNANKFMLFEHRDPFAEHQQKLWPEKTDWDRFARAEYDRMAAEAQ